MALELTPTSCILIHHHQAGILNCEQADDSERLILEYFDAIRDSPSHIYHSALPLSPSSSWVRECYKSEVVGEVRVLTGLPDQWDACSRTILLEDEPMAFAHWGDFIAVGINSNVVLLDAVTGIRTSVLSGHEDTILSLVFSLDGTLLVSRSNDKTVKLWDVQTGGAIKTFGNPASAISSVSISPDCTTIASGTWDGAIRFWDVRTGSCYLIETSHDGAVMAICFSPVDSQRLITSSMGTTVQQWNVEGYKIGASHREGAIVLHITYSPDGTRFASCTGDVVTVRDSRSGAVVVRLEAPNRTSMRRCSFSPDGKLMACAADRTIFVWDIANPGARLVRKLVGHSNPIAFISFSSSLISAATDNSVKFWQSGNFLADPVTTGHMAALHGSIPIRSVDLFDKDNTIVTSDDSGVVKTWDLVTGQCKESFSTPAKGIRVTHLAGDTLIVVWLVGEEGEYHIWDAGKGRLLRKVGSSLGRINDLKISGDGSKLFGLCGIRVEARPIQGGEDTSEPVRHRDARGSHLIVRGSLVEFGDRKGWGWDFGGSKVSEYKELPDRPRLDVVDWSHDGSSKIKPRWVEDTVTKKSVFRIPERYMKSDTDIRWDGRYLLIWSLSGEVVIIDFHPVIPR